VRRQGWEEYMGKGGIKNKANIAFDLAFNTEACTIKVCILKNICTYSLHIFSLKIFFFFSYLESNRKKIDEQRNE
jgi:hypothetical protein